jgi:NADH:ubiquinone reductase (H+-translocating)
VVVGRAAPGPFGYYDKGNTAVVGKGFAVLQSGTVQMSGVAAFLAWAAVRLEFLAQSNLRSSVWSYVTGKARFAVDSGSPVARN